MGKQTKTRWVLVVALFLFCSCHGCNDVQKKAQLEDIVETNNKTESLFSLSAEQIFAHAPHFHFRGELKMTIKNGNALDENNETIDIIGSKGRIYLKKSTDSAHFIEIIADGDTYFVRNTGKEFRRGADNNPLYQSLIDDGLNLLGVLLNDFALRDRLAPKQGNSGQKIYIIGPGPIVRTSPFAQAFLQKTPSFKEIVGGDASGSFVVDEKTGLPKNCNLMLSILGHEDRSIWLKASFSLDLKAKGESIAMPTIREEEPQNYPVDVGRRFNEMMNAKESK